MKKLSALLCAAILLTAGTAQAHFGMVIPSRSAVLDNRDAQVTVTFAFAHPFEGNGMDLAVERAGVYLDGKAEDITASLAPSTFMGKKGFTATRKLARPGVYTFAMTPKPYFEPAEDKFIIHYTKSVVAAFGEEEGWNEPVGLPVEIVPLTRPFGAYTGNVFRGLVLCGGKPAANVPVEIEHYNVAGSSWQAPDDYMVTQTVMTDSQGVFAYGFPFGGWWGFAALVDGPGTLPFEGKDRSVELGGVLWMQVVDPVRSK